MSVAQIYDFEGAVEPAIKAVLVAMGLAAFTSQDEIDFQKDRPRVEVQFTLGAGQNRWVAINSATGLPVAALSPQETWNQRRESAWACTITFSAITAADIAEHSAYRAVIRNALATLWVRINEVNGLMTRHHLYMSSDGGNSSLQMAQDKAMFKTDFTFNGKISVQADAWPALVS
jgi:hypothetical protein